MISLTESYVRIEAYENFAKQTENNLFALALLATTAFGVAESKKSEATMSDLAMANVEAFANGESGSQTGTLNGNPSGTKFCCCPCSRDCAASSCSNC